MNRQDPHRYSLSGDERVATSLGDIGGRVAARDRNGIGINVIGTGGVAVADATPTVKGKLKLAGDLAGTADLPEIGTGKVTSTKISDGAVTSTKISTGAIVTTTIADDAVTKAKLDPFAVGEYDIRDYGGVEGADILAAMNAAQAAMPFYGGILNIPLNRPSLSAKFVRKKPIHLRGAGLGADIFNSQDWNAGTQINWTGGATPMFDWGVFSQTFAPADVDTAADTITIPGHGLIQGQLVKITSSTTLPAGINAGQNYYVRAPTPNAFQLAGSYGTSIGGAINITSQGTGTHTVHLLCQGGGLDGIVLNGGGTATMGFNFDSAQNLDIGVLGVRNLAAGGIGYDFHTDAGVANSMFIRAKRLVALTPTVARFRGTEHLGGLPYNSCHIDIGKIEGAFGSASNESGVLFQQCDNVTVGPIYLSRTGTGYGVELGHSTTASSMARSCTIVHFEADGGVKAFAPTTLAPQGSNRILNYARTNGIPQPSIDLGAKLFWAESGGQGYPAAGVYHNISNGGSTPTAPFNPGFFTHKFQGDTGAEYFVEARSNSGTAGFYARGKTAAGAAMLAVFEANPSNVTIGSYSANPFIFRQNAAEVFRLSASGYAEFPSGKRIGMGLIPETSIHLPHSTALADGLGFGTDASRMVLHRSGPNAAQWNNTDLTVGGFVQPVNGIKPGASGNGGVWFPQNGHFNAFAAGADTTPVAGTIYYTQVFIGCNCTVTGIDYVVGSVGGTDSVKVGLYDGGGILLASSDGTDTVGASGWQKVAFTAPLAVKGPGFFYMAVQFNGTTARFRTYMQATTSIQRPITGSQTGTFGTLATITSPSTVNTTANVGPFAATY